MGRSMDLRKITMIDLIQMVIGLSVAISLAWATRSIWSFVASSLAESVVSTLAGHLWLPGIRDRVAWDHKSLKELLHFGKWSSPSSFAGVLASNGNRLLLGAWFAPTGLGHYSIASRATG